MVNPASMPAKEQAPSITTSEATPVVLKETAPQPDQPKPAPLPITSKPLGTPTRKSRFSITEALQQKEKEEEVVVEEDTSALPQSHFTQTDLDREWELFLKQQRGENVLLYNAINGFKLVKQGENEILIHYPSETARSEFEKVQGTFFNHFRHKVNHFKLEIEYRMDIALKQEILTSKKIFEQMAEINPSLLKLHEAFKFDFS